MQELKRCPFCGEKSVLLNSSREIPEESAVFWVYCKNCGATTTTYDNREEAIECWNTRTHDWIPVEERLPEESGYYRVTVKNAELGDITEETAWFAYVDDYDMDESEWRELYGYEKVIAWRELSPYRPEPLETRKELDKDPEKDVQDSEWKRNFMKRFERRC